VKGNKLAYLLLGTVTLIFTILLFLCDGDDIQKEEALAMQMADTTIQIPIPDSAYGFPIDSFVIHKGNIKRNEFLADILLKYGVDYQSIDRLAKASRDVFDVRYLRHGNNYAIICANDSSEKALCFVYEPNGIDYVVYDLRDSINIYKGQKEVETRTREASGIINSSLFLTLQEQHISPALAMEMANVYAWTIDFYRIQKGDYFKVIFDEMYVDDQFIGVGKIHSADFHHADRDFYAFEFENATGADYFDEEGNSLRKAFLKSPLKFGRLTSGYTKRRFHPVQKRWKAHLGTDYAAPTGTPILAVGDGVVIDAKFSRFNGNYVKIRHNGTYTTQYLHMSKIGQGMKPGKAVRQGDVIGYVGSTGLATGPHVCFRFWKNGKQVDHRSEPMPPSKPIDENLREEFNAMMDVEKKRLDGIQLIPEEKLEPAKTASL